MRVLERIALVVFVLVLIVFVWPTAYVYYRKNGIDYRRSRFTGQLDQYTNGRWAKAYR